MRRWDWYQDSGGDVWYLVGDDCRTATVRKVRVGGSVIWEWECGERSGCCRTKADAMAKATRWIDG